VVKFTTNISCNIISQKVYNIFFFQKYYKFSQIWKLNKSFIILKACSSVDRASDSDSESQGFDSLHAYSLYSQNRSIFGADLVSTFKIN
jgi:hypothetical protein